MLIDILSKALCYIHVFKVIFIVSDKLSPHNIYTKKRFLVKQKTLTNFHELLRQKRSKSNIRTKTVPLCAGLETSLPVSDSRGIYFITKG